MRRRKQEKAGLPGRRVVAFCVVALGFVAGLAVSAGAGLVTVLATTTIAGDVVRQVAGDRADVHTLMRAGADPHSFEAAPQDVVAIATAEVVFVSGAGLEADIAPLLDNATGPVIALSDPLALRTLGSEAHAPAAAESAADVDPHVWFDPTNVMVWTRVIEEALSQVDPDGAATYAANAAEYRRALSQLDLWIWEQIEAIPYDRRQLVADHWEFGYFAGRYGFQQLGSLSPGLSPSAEPSAKELADLETAIRGYGVPAVFVGTTVNPVLAQAVAADTGATIVSLYTGSLSAAGGEADSYVTLMQFDVTAIVGALSP